MNLPVDADPASTRSLPLSTVDDSIWKNPLMSCLICGDSSLTKAILEPWLFSPHPASPVTEIALFDLPLQTRGKETVGLCCAAWRAVVPCVFLFDLPLDTSWRLCVSLAKGLVSIPHLIPP